MIADFQKLFYLQKQGWLKDFIDVEMYCPHLKEDIEEYKRRKNKEKSPAFVEEFLEEQFKRVE